MGSLLSLTPHTSGMRALAMQAPPLHRRVPPRAECWGAPCGYMHSVSSDTVVMRTFKYGKRQGIQKGGGVQQSTPPMAVEDSANIGGECVLAG